MKEKAFLKELTLGIALGVAVFLGIQGYNIMPVVALAALFFVLSASPAMRAASRSQTVTSDAGTGVPRVSFEEIGGQEAAKKELTEALDFIVHREKMQLLGIRALKGLLLTGPPGTGKTLLAKAAAGYTGSVFLAASGSEFVEMY